MTDRQINKWLRKQFSTVGWVLLGCYFLMNLMVTATAGVYYLKQILNNVSLGVFPFDVDLDAVYNNAWGYAAAIGVGIRPVLGSGVPGEAVPHFGIWAMPCVTGSSSA